MALFDKMRNMTPEKKKKWANALFLLGGGLQGKDIAQQAMMLKQVEATNKAEADAAELEKLKKEYQLAIASGDLDRALAIGARLNPASTQQALVQQKRDLRPQVIDGGKYTVTYEDGMPVVTPNQAVIDAELAAADFARKNEPLPSTLIKDELEDEDLIDKLKISTSRSFTTLSILDGLK